MLATITFRLNEPDNFLDLRGQRAAFVVLAAFLISFLLIRTSARLTRSVSWWPGGVKTGSGLHLHHLVWGIVLMMAAGFVRFAIELESPWTEIVAGTFGVGMGFTLDEFALWIYLRDVYWAEEGRSSFDAVVVAALIGGLIVVGVAPFDLRDNGSATGTLALLVLVDVIPSVVSILKGKPILGLIGIFVFPVSMVGAVRLAAPRSWWARQRYRSDGRKLARAEVRWTRIRGRRRRIADAIAGAPHATPAGSEDRQ